jgi:hypothetical protein
VNPADANSQRRKPLVDVTSIHSGSGNHTAEVPPKKL